MTVPVSRPNLYLALLLGLAAGCGTGSAGLEPRPAGAEVTQAPAPVESPVPEAPAAASEPAPAAASEPAPAEVPVAETRRETPSQAESRAAIAKLAAVAVDEGEEPLPPPPEPRDRGTKTESGVMKYSNEDLAGLGGGSASGDAPASPETEGDRKSAAELGDKYLAESAWTDAERMKAAQERAARESLEKALRTELDELAVREAGLRNPLLPRGTESQAEKALPSGSDSNARIAAIQRRRDEIYAELKKESNP
jgi:hypothetical protein